MTEKEYFCVPRNVRQIGEVMETYRVYIEDYAYTFLDSTPESLKEGRICVLLGKSYKKEKNRYVFVRSALWTEGLDMCGETFNISDLLWGKIKKEQKQYFPQQDIVGWHMTVSDHRLEITEKVSRIWHNCLRESGELLLLGDPGEKEDALFEYRSGELTRLKGYYIYYERNEPMQEYLVWQNRNESIEVQGVVKDRAVKDFRKIIAEKKEEKDTKHTNRFLYAASAGLVFAALGAGLAFLSRMPQVEDMQVGVQTAAEKVLGIYKDASDTETTGREISNTETQNAETKNAETAGKETPKIEASGTETQNPETQNTETQNAEIQNTETSDVDAGGIKPEKEEQDDQEDLVEKNKAETETQTTDAQQKYAVYTVREGDTLNVISYRYYGTIFEVQDICDLNQLSLDDIIYPGQKILLP